MATKVQVAQDGSISYDASDALPATTKKFRKSAEVNAFYRFIYEHDLRKETFEIIDRNYRIRAEKKAAAKKAARKK